MRLVSVQVPPPAAATGASGRRDDATEGHERALIRAIEVSSSVLAA